MNIEEKSQGFTVIEGTDIATFTRFLEWCYIGFYNPPLPSDSEPEDAVTSAKEEHEEKNADPNVFGSVGRKVKRAKKAKKVDNPPAPPGPNHCFRWQNQPAYTQCNAYGEPLTSCQTSGPRSVADLGHSFSNKAHTEFRPIILAPAARANENEGEDYTDVFLCHARLHVFAEEKDIQKLKTLALENLHECLKVFTLHCERTGDICALLRYVYEDTATPEDGEDEPMRAMLKEYVCMEMATLALDEELTLAILEDGGPMLRD